MREKESFNILFDLLFPKYHLIKVVIFSMHGEGTIKLAVPFKSIYLLATHWVWINVVKKLCWKIYEGPETLKRDFICRLLTYFSFLKRSTTCPSPPPSLTNTNSFTPKKCPLLYFTWRFVQALPIMDQGDISLESWECFKLMDDTKQSHSIPRLSDQTSGTSDRFTTHHSPFSESFCFKICFNTWVLNCKSYIHVQ